MSRITATEVRQRHGLGDRHGHLAGLPITVGVAPYGLAVSPDGTKVYVTNFGPPAVSTGTVSVIKTANRGVVATIPVGNYPTGGRVHPGWDTRLRREC